MLKMTVIGHIGKDAEVKYVGAATESVISFSVAHTDKWKDNGVPKERTTWVSCSWWVESTTVAQYMKKGTQVYIEGIPEAKAYKNKQGESQPYLNLRVFSLQLLSSGRRDGDNTTQANTQTASDNQAGGYTPFQAPNTNSSDPVDDLPF